MAETNQPQIPELKIQYSSEHESHKKLRSTIRKSNKQDGF